MNRAHALRNAPTDGNTAQRRVNHGHIGAAQLGTCDEAGGAPVTPQRVKFAKANEAASERVRDALRARATGGWTAHSFSGAIAAIGAALAVGIWAFP